MSKKKESKQANPGARKKIASVPKSESRFYSISLLVILAVTFISYISVPGNHFTNWDDNSYIQGNGMIRSINLKEIFSHNLMGNYHPLTMLVYSIEFHFFQLNEQGYYVVNLLIHLLNTLLVSKVVFKLSNRILVALVATLLFGIHPIHVESVAWASELKDLLYTFFFLFSYNYYLKYIDDPRRKYYVLCMFLFLLSLLSKAMAVSLPAVLLLTDYLKGRKIDVNNLKEKIPFFILSIIFGLVAVRAQQTFGSTESTVFPLPYRIVFAAYSFITYLIKLFAPIDLCAYYPYPIKPGETIPSQYYIYLGLLVILFAAFIYFLRSSKKIFFGISFFIITIILVLQLFPVGDTIMADRYCYIPSIGIFYLAGELFYWMWEQKKKVLSISILSLFALFFSIQTYARCSVWKNGMTLWDDVIMQHPDAAAAYSNRGFLEMNDKKYNEALADFKKAIELKPDYAFAYNNLAVVLKNMGTDIEIILRHLNKALELKPNYVDALNNRGIIYTIQKKYDEAISDFNKSIELQPNSADAYSNRGIALFNAGNINDGCLDFQKAARLGNQNAANIYKDYCH